VGRLGEGPWRVVARAPGFDDATERAPHDGSVVTLVLRKLGALLVHVDGPDGEPAPDALVDVAGASLWPPRAARTGAGGEVRIGALTAGSYALRATRGDLASPIEIGAPVGRGEERRVTLRLAPGGFVAVRVTNGDADDAEAVAGAQIGLTEGGLSPFPLEATTDGAGRARLGPIAEGLATVDAHASGFVSRGAVAVTARPGTAIDAHLVLVRAGTLTGRVVDGRGRPIDGATLEITGTDPAGGPILDDPQRSGFREAHFEAMLAGPAALVASGELGVVPGPVPPIPRTGAALAASLGLGAPGGRPWVTREDGRFEASPVTPGRIRAVVRHPQYVEAESDLVTLAPGAEQQVDITMHEGGSLEGRVLDARDRPVEGARVTVAATRGSLERSTRTATDGSFAFAALPDAVTLSAGASDDAQPPVRLALGVPEGGRREVTIHLPEPRAALSVTVVDERGWGVDAAQITAASLSAGAPLRSTAFSDARGQATIPGAHGLPLRVDVRAPHHAPRVVTVDAAGDELRVELLPGESATGEVVAARGRDAIAAADVTLYTDTGVRRTRTDAKGAFSLSDLAPGPARLRVRAAGFAAATREVDVPDSGGRRSFTLPRVELAGSGTVRGEVVDERGEPVAGARVARDQVPTWLLVGATPEGVAVTDAKGHFTLNDLPEGALAIEAYSPELGRARLDDVSVTAGRTTEDVRLVFAAPDGGEPAARAPSASGGVAVTLGETSAPVEVVVVTVVEGSEAERAGVLPGDVVVAVDGNAVSTIEEARARLSGPIADDVVVAVRRGEAPLTLRVPREAVRR
jgi:protocatechuate 3,4-dioxygenase beta subunit